MEGDAKRFLATGIMPDDLRPPGHVLKLIDGTLGGDARAIGLLGTPLADLVRNGSFPVAVRAEFWIYDFSTWDSLRDDGAWWKRRRLSEPVVYRRPPEGSAAPPRRPPPERPRVLLAAAAAAVRYGRGRARGLRDALLLAFFAAAFVAAFAAAYRDDATAFRSTFRGVGGGVALAALSFARRSRPPRARDACDALLLGALYVAARDASRSEALLRAALP